MKKISWILMFLSIIGNIFVNFKSVVGMYIWLLASVGWTIYSYKKKEHALSVLNLIYSILNFSGIIMWSK